MTSGYQPRFAFVWRNGESVRVERSILESLISIVQNEAERMSSSITQSRFCGACISYSAKTDELARVEQELDEQLRLDDVPIERIKGGVSYAETEEKKKFAWEVSWEEYRDRHRETITLTLPSNVVNLMEDAAPGERKQGWWLSNAILRLVNQPFSSRLERIETKQQMLRIIHGEQIDDDEMTAVLMQIKYDDDVYPDIHDALYGENPWKSTDWSSVALNNDLVLKRENIRSLENVVAKRKNHRIPATAAAIRHYIQEKDGDVTKSECEALVKELNDDYAGETLDEIVNTVVKRLDYEYGLPRFDDLDAEDTEEEPSEREQLIRDILDIEDDYLGKSLPIVTSELGIDRKINTFDKRDSLERFDTEELRRIYEYYDELEW